VSGEGDGAGAVERNAAVVRRQWDESPRLGIVLGTGLGELAARIASGFVVTYEQLDGLPAASAPGHAGRLICGRLGNVAVVAMQGRCHRYEGHSFTTLAAPIQLINALGAKTLIVSNAAGGLNPQFAVGDLMVVDGHVNLMGRGAFLSDPSGEIPARGAALGTRLESPYDETLAATALEAARCGNFACHRGVYVAVSGPNYETRAEYRFLRRVGDAVGMSTVPEVLAAARCGMRVLAISTITNVARPDVHLPVDAGHVVDVAEHAEPRLTQVVRRVAASLGELES